MENNFRIYSYIMRDDTGFAPNPFHGICTLACCKPVIRRNAEIGSWIVGIRGKQLYDNYYKKLKTMHENDPVHKIIYMMKVTKDPIDFDTYFKNYPQKRPQMQQGQVIYKCGDNIYRRDKKNGDNDDFSQIPSMHSERDKNTRGYIENKKTKDHDLGGKKVLLSTQFYYFGSKGLEINNLDFLIKKGPGHKKITDEKQKEIFMEFINSLNYKPGIYGKPHVWADNDQSWSENETIRSKCGC